MIHVSVPHATCVALSGVGVGVGAVGVAGDATGPGAMR